MREEKLKLAFDKVKLDMNSLSDDISKIKAHMGKLSSAYNVSSDVEKQIRRLEKVDLEKFVDNLENEFTNMNLMIKEFNDKFKETSSFIQTFSKQLEKYHVELDDLKKRILNMSNKSENTHLDVDVLNTRFEDLQQLINEKIDLEVANLRMEFVQELIKLQNSSQGELMASSNGPDFVEYHEKKLARIKEKNFKKKNQTQTSKKLKSNNEKSLKENNNSEGKFKKAVKWLFVDEEDDDFSEIKGEVKKSETKSKNQK